jgi:hypothetical protein
VQSADNAESAESGHCEKIATCTHVIQNAQSAAGRAVTELRGLAKLEAKPHFVNKLSRAKCEDCDQNHAQDTI